MCQSLDDRSAWFGGIESFEGSEEGAAEKEGVSKGGYGPGSWEGLGHC